jgi:hypothetical protein
MMTSAMASTRRPRPQARPGSAPIPFTALMGAVGVGTLAGYVIALLLARWTGL